MQLAKIRILIADDHVLVRSTIRALLNSQPDMEVVAAAANGKEAINLAKACEPDIVVMDISMPELDGIRAIEKIRSLQLPLKVVILSLYANVALVQQARNRGAKGFVAKQNAAEQLPEAIRRIQKGGLFFNSSLPGATQPVTTP
jgi:DNA-binding NarL/FixJ family response regulator